MSERRLVLVGRHYKAMNTTWTEWSDKTFDEVVEEMRGRRSKGGANDAPDEIVEVVVVRSAVIRTEIVSVEETENAAAVCVE